MSKTITRTKKVTIKGKWQEVYAVVDAATVTDRPEFQENTFYYQTSGGGPEGGYFVKVGEDEYDLNKSWLEGIWVVERTWGQPWTITPLTSFNGKYGLEYQPEDEMEGKTARLRLIRNKVVLNFKAHLIDV